MSKSTNPLQTGGQVALAISKMLLTATALGTGLVLAREGLSRPVLAEPTRAELAQIAPAPLRSTLSISQLEADASNLTTAGRSTGTMPQVTSVSQLSDVQPTDWAFQALQSLVEKYGCIAGYPDSTFRGNRAATRYELAAALNACLDVISDRFATKEDLAALRKLQEEFAAELATLRGRVDNLEARTAQLEAVQFSTTTKLSGTALMAFQYGQSAGDFTAFDPAAGSFNRVSGGRTNPTVISRMQLNLTTSFNGKDSLETVLQAGNSGLDTVAALGSGVSGFVNSGSVDYAGFSSSISLWRLVYNFEPIKNLTLSIGPRLFPSDFIDTNSYANNSFEDFSSGFFINNRLTVPLPVDGPGGAGGFFDWNVGGGPFTVRGGYVAASPDNATKNDFGGGFFGDPYQATLELEYANTFGKDKQNNYAVRLQYTNSTAQDISQNAGGLNVELSLGKFGIFGRYGYSGGEIYGNGANTILPFATVTDSNQSFTAQTWMAGVGYRDLWMEGSLLAAAVGQPFINDLPETPGSDAPNDAVQMNYELFYWIPVSDNISITPVLMVITDANNNSANSPIVQGLVRTTFSF
jgi:Carbohydrate-selective porin, OprB family/S-layer homology domain